MELSSLSKYNLVYLAHPWELIQQKEQLLHDLTKFVETLALKHKVRAFCPAIYTQGMQMSYDEFMWLDNAFLVASDALLFYDIGVDSKGAQQEIEEMEGPVYVYKAKWGRLA